MGSEDRLLPAPLSSSSSSSSTRTGAALTQVIVTFAVALTLGFILGQRQRPDLKWDGLLQPQGTITTVWQHNLTFSQHPTPESEAAWNSIIPVGRGFVHHPDLAPFISNIAVFHQLHCLHAILVTYYAAIEASNTTAKDDFLQHTGTRMAPSHIRHCFDYLRRSLMCAADTNMEVLNPETHTTSGWNQSRRCRDYDGVVSWAEMWANSSDTGIVT